MTKLRAFEIDDMLSRGVDPLLFADEPTSPTPYRDMTEHDMDVLGMGVEGYDCVQVALSRVVTAGVGAQREVIKTRYLPIEAVKTYLERKHHG